VTTFRKDGVVTTTLIPEIIAELSASMTDGTKASLSKALRIYAYRNGLDATSARSDDARETRRAALTDLAREAADALSGGQIVPAASEAKFRRLPEGSLAEELGVEDEAGYLAEHRTAERTEYVEGTDEEPEVEEVS